MSGFCDVCLEEYDSLRKIQFQWLMRFTVACVLFILLRFIARKIVIHVLSQNVNRDKNRSLRKAWCVTFIGGSGVLSDCLCAKLVNYLFP